MPEKRINCYECRYRGIIPGDAHSRCQHPEVVKSGISDEYTTAMTEVFITACSGFESKDDEKKE